MLVSRVRHGWSGPAKDLFKGLRTKDGCPGLPRERRTSVCLWNGAQIRVGATPVQVAAPRSLLIAEDLRGTEGLEAFDAEFEAVAGLLGAAERNARVNCAVFVNPDAAGFDPGSDGEGGVLV